MIRDDSFFDFVSGKSFKLICNCITTFLVYRLGCECGYFYIGRTKRMLRDRLSEHINAFVSQNPNYPMATHYKVAKHPSLSSLRATAIEVIPKSIRGGITLRHYTLKATEYPGLNDDNDFYPVL